MGAALACVHGLVLLRAAEIGFGFACESWIKPEQGRIVIRIHEYGVQRWRVLLASADHRLATHLLFGFLGDLDRGDGGVRHLACALEGIFHFAFEFRENAHRCSFFAAFLTSRFSDCIYVVAL